jgi:hypothetical protein
MPQISQDKCGINNKTYKNENASNNKKWSRRDKYATHYARDDCWTSHKSSHVAEPVTPLLVTTDQVQATTTKNTILVIFL